MKKLVIALFALCAAVTAQAAYVDWQYSVREPTSGGADWTSGHTAYLVTAAAWDSFKDAKGNYVVTSDGLAAAALDSSAFYNVGSTKQGIVYSTGAAGSQGVRQVEADSGNYYVILADESGYSIALDNVTVSAYADATGAGTGLTPAITIGKSNAVSSAGISYTAFAVPEPTSGLLMLVGLGALALRRRRA